MLGDPFDLTFAMEDDKISCILWVGYLGESCVAAIANVIPGVYNPGNI
jgi:beta-D-xylosidase 4